ncbi:MAG: ATP-dependent DNA helicase [Clostridia bacterium]|nr:ATP-dependent DNA helicase [Clostridia bacterium]
MRYDADRNHIELSVRELCETALLRGDIDCRRSSVNLYERAAEGKRVHQKLQTSFGALYHSEVELRNTSKLDEIFFYVKGRADGIICHNGNYTVDEIKTVGEHRFASKIVDRLHTAQLYCYAYFLCQTKGLAGVNTRIIYYNVEDGEIEYNEKFTAVEELRSFYHQLLSCVVWRARLLRERARERMPSAASCVFPYSSLRESQEEMIRECYRDLKNGNRLFCQAPTGIGKTMSTLYPSVKCIGEGIADKIFYLTSKASIRREAFAAAERLHKAGARIRALVLSSREQMCVNEAAKLCQGRLSSNCNPELCPYAKGYYDKLNGALEELLSLSDQFDSRAVKEFATAKGLCPYELSLDLSELCDVIVCDYNYVFSPTVYLKRYFDDNAAGKERFIFLVDEAHNLPDRARDMFSSRLTTDDFERVLSLSGESGMLTDACLSLLRSFETLEKLCHDNMQYDGDGRGVGYYVARDLPENFVRALSAFSEKCDTWMKHNYGHAAYYAAEDLSFKLYEFKKICECFDRHYLTFINTSYGKTSLLLYCLDPSHNLSVALERAHASILFSATLTPTDYFADILGGGKKTVSVSFRSPFPRENLCIAAVDKISTRFEDREKSVKKIASCIAATVSAKVGNYMVFFPSYGFMDEVHKIFHAKYPKVRTLPQKKNMTYSEKETYLAEFCDDGKLRIGFCVLGGSFSEGIDLPGRRLIGTVVVGVGLPGLSDENNIIRDYYEEKCGMGYDYAYTYPGMNSVLQAVGRVIRTESDRGIAVLIDDRYAEPKYRALYPEEWKGIKFAGNPQSLAEIARRFWQNEE